MKGAICVSTNVILSEPLKNGPWEAEVEERSGSISFSIVVTNSVARASFSGRSAKSGLNHELPILVLQVSMKKEIRALVRAAVGEVLEGGRRWDGCRSQRNWDTIADSVIISSLMVRSLDVYLRVGTRPRF